MEKSPIYSGYAKEIPNEINDYWKSENEDYDFIIIKVDFPEREHINTLPTQISVGGPGGWGVGW